ARTLEARGKIYIVAERRIVEAPARAEIADRAWPGSESDTESHRSVRTSRAPRFRLPTGVQLLKLGHHSQRRPRRRLRMFGIVERRVPECHDRIADIFIQRR